jgi:membrane-bound lytic murein transglycosylase A
MLTFHALPTLRHRSIPLCLAALAGVLTLVAGCQSEPKLTDPRTDGPNYSRPLPPGAHALVRVTDPEAMPDLERAFRVSDARLLDAIEASLTFFAAPSSRNHFPFELADRQVTHDQMRGSLLAARAILLSRDAPTAKAERFLDQFDVYQSVGYDGLGVVLFTGYYAPELPASRSRTGQFTSPLYTRPADLVTDPATGEPLGRRTADGSTVPYYTREAIETGRLLEGSELVWLEDSFDAYLVHVNGSAKLRMQDGSIMYVGYDGKTDRPYASLGRALVDAELLPADRVSIQSIRGVYHRQRAEVERLMFENESFVFFTEYDGGNWPAGSLGVPVTAECSLATDKSIYPRGGLVLVDTDQITFTGGRKAFHRFMLDQDTGGAIKAPGRADLFLGIGEHVGILAGKQYAEGRLYYFFLKPDAVAPAKR